MFYRKTFIALLVALPLLAARPGRTHDNPENVSSGDEDSLLVARLERYVVSPGDFARKEFYTWTKPEQVNELRNGKEILSRSVSAKGGPSHYDVLLASVSDTAPGRFPVAVALRESRFSKKRFAWTSAWPTVMGWEKEKYGNQLLKITLKDSAIIVGFMPFCRTIFDYRDINGNQLSETYVLANTHRIAAVYFCGAKTGTRTQSRGTMGKTKRTEMEIGYREYVICNEQMIASFEYGTVAIKQEMEEEIILLNDLEKFLRLDGKKDIYFPVMNNFCYDDYWRYPLERNYYSSLALPNDYYLKAPDRVKTISATMKRARAAQGAPLSR